MPTEIDVVPVYVLAADSSSVPAPVLVRPAAVGVVAPEMIPDIVAVVELATCTVTSADIATVPDNVPDAEKFTAPADDTPVPEIVNGSADDTAPATSNVAPLATVVVEYVLTFLPSASALVIFTVPAEMAVVPVYVFVPDSVRMLELEVSFVSVPVPEITPVCSVWFDDDEYTKAELFVIAAEYVPEPSEPASATVNVPAEMVVAPL